MANELYLKEDFSNWLKELKKTNGKNYSSATMGIYVNCLMKTSSNLKNANLAQTDLFYCTTVADFTKTRSEITSQSDFAEVDYAASHNAFSAAMNLYMRFLKEKEGYKTRKEQMRDYSIEHLNQIFTTDDIKKELNEKYGTPFNSVIPTDYCYNCTNEGINFDLTTRFFEKIEGGSFKSLGPNYPYNGTVYSKKDLFGEWVNGEFTKKYIQDNSMLNSLFDLFLEYKNNTEKYDEQYKWDFAQKYEGQFRNCDNLIEKLSGLEAYNFQSYFMRNSGIRWLIHQQPEELTQAFKELFNLQNDIATRIKNFRAIIEEALLEDEGWKNKKLADPGVDTAAFFLFADNYKENLLFTKMRPFNNLAKKLKLDYLLNSKDEQRYINWQKYCKNELLPAMNKYFNKEHTLLDVQDFIWFMNSDEVNNENEILSATPAVQEVSNEISESGFDNYTKDDFLKEVFMDEYKYEKLKNLLLNKKNIILQGAPGVGKTYAAKRLAYSILGEKDTSKVKMVQFHQSYGYEDFIMGYRPNESGFELKCGPFYHFCKTAEADPDNDYFFIIDEINRGKLSKILGELLMLIETDKRGLSIQLLYKDEPFCVPKNVYIIGMMNTADRSLAMMDYALRRRFAFFEFEPAFETQSFIDYQTAKKNGKYNALIKEIINLNKVIADDPCLGEGFKVGHSYFCTNKVVDNEWLKAVIEYEITPLLKEYWFDEPEKYNSWITKLKAQIN